VDRRAAIKRVKLAPNNSAAPFFVQTSPLALHSNESPGFLGAIHRRRTTKVGYKVEFNKYSGLTLGLRIRTDTLFGIISASDFTDAQSKYSDNKSNVRS
jgi:hypothetical protein